MTSQNASGERAVDAARQAAAAAAELVRLAKTPTPVASAHELRELLGALSAASASTELAAGLLVETIAREAAAGRWRLSGNSSEDARQQTIHTVTARLASAEQLCAALRATLDAVHAAAATLDYVAPDLEPDAVEPRLTAPEAAQLRAEGVRYVIEWFPGDLLFGDPGGCEWDLWELDEWLVAEGPGNAQWSNDPDLTRGELASWVESAAGVRVERLTDGPPLTITGEAGGRECPVLYVHVAEG
ncbi:MAG: hypothetical protein M3P91_12690 [Actinomycetota bacterium]|nr:hypothetical protein [Actinomycetota bacterium]